MIRRRLSNPVPAARGPAARRGFTLIELLATIAVIFLIMGIAVVAYTAAVRSARGAADRSAVSGLKLAIGQFKSEFGFLPPLVMDDGGTLEAEPLARFDRGAVGPPVYIPVVLSAGIPADARVLRGEEDDRQRYSDLSIGYYIVGGLSAEVDGVDGPGFAEVRPDGRFAPVQAYVDGDGDVVEGSARGPKLYKSFFDLGRGGVELFIEPASASTLDVSTRVELRDRAGNAYRYYRWLPDTTPFDAVAGDPDAYTDDDYGYGYLGSDTVTVSGLVAYFNVPAIVLDAIVPIDTDDSRSIEASDTASAVYTLPLELRNARYAIVAAGPNQLFGDDTPDDLASDASLRRRYAQQLNLSEALLASDADYRVEAILEARADNVAEVGS